MERTRNWWITSGAECAPVRVTISSPPFLLGLLRAGTSWNVYFADPMRRSHETDTTQFLRGLTYMTNR